MLGGELQVGGGPHEGRGHVTDRGVRTEEVGKGEGEVWLSGMNVCFWGKRIVYGGSLDFRCGELEE